MTIILPIVDDDDDDDDINDDDGIKMIVMAILVVMAMVKTQDDPFQTGWLEQSGLPAPPLKMLKTMIFTPRQATQTQTSTLMLVSCPTRLSSISTYQQQKNIALRCATLTLT